MLNSFIANLSFKILKNRLYRVASFCSVIFEYLTLNNTNKNLYMYLKLHISLLSLQVHCAYILYACVP